MEVISLILVAALLLGAGAISIELGISVAILEILIGVFASNALEIGDVSWMEFLSTFGLVGIMFFAGFETDHKLLKENWKQSILIGSISYFFTFLLVFLLSYFYLAQSMMSSLLLSIGLSTTSLALVYAIMTERKMLDRKLGQIILSSAMVVDVLSMVSLMVIFEGVSWRSLFTLVIFMVGLVYFPRIGMWFFKRYHHDNVEFQSRFILVVMLSLILVARAIHIHLAIIAFITGFMLSDIVKQNKQLKANLQAVIFGFMAPLFFFKAGLSIKLEAVNMATVKVAAVMGTIAFIAKYLSTSFAFQRYYRRSVGHFAGLVFNYRLSFGIVIASFGLSEGLLSQDIYIGVLIVVVATSVISTLVMKFKRMPTIAEVPGMIIHAGHDLGVHALHAGMQVGKEALHAGKEALDAGKRVGQFGLDVGKKGIDVIRRELGPEHPEEEKD